MDSLSEDSSAVLRGFGKREYSSNLDHLVDLLQQSDTCLSTSLGRLGPTTPSKI